MGDSQYIQNSETGRFEGSEGSGAGEAASKAAWSETASVIGTAEQDAVSRYTANDYRSINGYLRGEEGFSPDEKVFTELGHDNQTAQEAAGNIDAAIASQIPTAADSSLYRVTYGAGYSELSPGAVITEQGFVSTSSSDFIGKGMPLGENAEALRIDVPSGSQGLDVQATETGHLGGEGESEVILPRGSAFQVLAQEGQVTRVQLLPQDSGSPDIATLMREPTGVGFSMTANALHEALTNTGNMSGLHAALGGK